MGCTTSRIEAAAAGRGACGGCGWRKEVVYKGKEDCGGGQNMKIDTVQVVEIEGDKNNERKINDQIRDDELIWSPGSPSFRDYLFVGSFDSNERRSIEDATGARAFEESIDKPVEVVHPRKVNAWTIPAKSRVNIIKYGRMLDGRKYLNCTKKS